MEHEFPFWTFQLEKWKIYSRKFSTGTTRKVFFRLLFNWILTKCFVSGRQPKNENNRDYFDLAVVQCNCHLQHSVYIRVWRSRYACINFFICFSTKTSRKLAIIVPHQGYQATFISKGNAVQFRLKKVKRSLPFCCIEGLFWKSYLFDSRSQLRRTLGPISPPKQSYCEIRHTPTQSLAKQPQNYHLQYAHIEIRVFC